MAKLAQTAICLSIDATDRFVNLRTVACATRALSSTCDVDLCTFRCTFVGIRLAISAANWIGDQRTSARVAGTLSLARLFDSLLLQRAKTVIRFSIYAADWFVNAATFTIREDIPWSPCCSTVTFVPS